MQTDQPYTVIISNRSDKILGRYLDADIHETVETEDGRTFIFESIAVAGVNGKFLVDFPRAIYMVFQNLLYREI